jgi:hypothetical protein
MKLIWAVVIVFMGLVLAAVFFLSSSILAPSATAGGP